MLEKEKQNMNEVETEKVSGGEGENVKVKISDSTGMDVHIPGIDQNPKLKYKCLECGGEFWFRQPGSPTSPGAVMVKCSSCGSPNVEVVKD